MKVKDITEDQQDQLSKEPVAVTVLTSLLNENPVPTELGIAILRVDNDDNHKHNGEYQIISDKNSYPHNAFVKIETNLGINAADLPKLAHEYRQEHTTLRRILLQSGSVVSRAPCQTLQDRIMKVTSCLLLLCPDNYTAWADRSRIIESENKKICENKRNIVAQENRQRQLLRDEITFINLIFTQHSKKPSSWLHRKWICRKLLENILYDGGNQTLIQQKKNDLFSWAEDEISICTFISERNPKNYYAWTHRLFVAKTMMDILRHKCNGAYLNGSHRTDDYAHNENGFNSSFGVKFNTFLMNEVRKTLPWLKNHVSDHSCAHYGSEVLHLFTECTFLLGMNNSLNFCNVASFDRCNLSWTQSQKANDDKISIQSILMMIMLVEIEKTRSMLQQTHLASHEVLWIYRRFCGALFLDIASGSIPNCSNSAPSKVQFGSISPWYNFRSSKEEERSDNGRKEDIKKVQNMTYTFLNSEVKDLIEMYVENVQFDENHLKKKNFDIEVEKIRVNAMLYVVWIISHLKKVMISLKHRNLFEEKVLFSSQLDIDDMESLQNLILTKLRRETSVVHHFWRVLKRR